MPDKPTILVVDDDLVALELIGHTLESLGVRPKCVQSSPAAAELINKEKYHGVFLDWMMPEVDGLDLARRIRSSKSNKSVPIVMLTGRTEPEAMEEAFHAGVNFFLTKPVTPEKVKKLLDASRGMILAERRRYQRAVVCLGVLCTWDGQRVRGRTLNLSSSGVLLQAENLPPVGAVLGLALELPGGAERIELVGMIARTVPGAGVGIRFTEYRPGDRKRLADFVEKLAQAPRRTVF